MRGKGRPARLDDLRHRITPAYAGKSCALIFASAGAGDYPRICGEKPNRLLWEHWKQGSPPHMRGKVRPCGTEIHGDGITPAYAGKSRLDHFLKLLQGDHPRICGEKSPGPPQKRKWLGSPPHMRGKVFVHGFSIDKDRITPAYAGKSRRLWNRTWSTPDHPRICGEKFFSVMVVLLQDGITPAYAGKSQ